MLEPAWRGAWRAVRGGFAWWSLLRALEQAPVTLTFAWLVWLDTIRVGLAGRSRTPPTRKNVERTSAPSRHPSTSRPRSSLSFLRLRATPQFRASEQSQLIARPTTSVIGRNGPPHVA